MAEIENRRYALVRNEYTLPASTTGDVVLKLLAVLGNTTSAVGVAEAAAELANMAKVAKVRVEAGGDGIRFFTETVSEGPWPT